MEYSELVNFLEHKMSMTHVYQPLMIKTLLENGGQCSTRTIAKKFLQKDKSQIQYYEYIAKRWPKITLKKHNIISYKDNIFTLNASSLSENQKKDLIEVCNVKIEEHIRNKGDAMYDYRAEADRNVPGSLQYDIFAKARGMCVACGAKSTRMHIDHILPVKSGGKTERDNLQALCYLCNTQKRDRDDTNFLQEKKDMGMRDPQCRFCALESKPSNEKPTAFVSDGPDDPMHRLIMPRRHVRSFFCLHEAELSQCYVLLKEERDAIISEDKSVTGFSVEVNEHGDQRLKVSHCHINLLPNRQA